VLASCSSGSSDHDSVEVFPVRISPVRVESAGSTSDTNAWFLFDRDTRAGWAPAMGEIDNTARVRVALGETATITHLKIFGASPYVLDAYTEGGSPIKGLEQVRLDGLGAGWNALPVPEGISVDGIVLALVPTADAAEFSFTMQVCSQDHKFSQRPRRAF
jgi:hypothetical protein